MYICQGNKALHVYFAQVLKCKSNTNSDTLLIIAAVSIHFRSFGQNMRGCP